MSYQTSDNAASDTSAAPRTSVEWKGKIVLVTQDFKNRGGEIFHAGDRLIVKRKLRDGTFELARPPARVSGVTPNLFVLDHLQRSF